MNKSTLISEMQKFRFGSPIFCMDGEEGILTNVIFDPAARRIMQIGVKLRRFFGKTVHVPYTAVTGASSDSVTLNMKRAELEATSTVRGNGVLLDGKSVVEQGGTANRGTLLLVAVHPESGVLAYIVVHHLRPGQDTLLREEYISDITPGLIVINISDEAFNALPPYESDDVLQREVEAILFDLAPLHIELKGMTIRVLDGVLYLDGNISSKLRGDIAVDQALGVPGLLEIVNNLVGDDILAAGLARVLGDNPVTSDLPIGVYPRLGVVRLGGAVHNNQQKTVTGDMAKNFPGVRSVINDLVVNPKADLLRVMSPSEAGNAEDKVPGKYIRHTG